MERITGLLVLLALGAIGLAMRPQYFDFTGGLFFLWALILGVSAILAAALFWNDGVTRLLRMLPVGETRLLNKVIDILARITSAMTIYGRQPGSLVTALALSLPFYLIVMWFLYLILVGAGASVSLGQFIGGAYPFSHFAGFWDGYLFGQAVTELETAEFEQYANLYNLGWTIVFSDDSKRVFDRMPGVSPIAGYEAMKLYRIDREHSYFLEGQGRVTARGHNRLELENLQGKEVIIKYHYLSGIDSIPPANIEPVTYLDAPGAFIKIVNPPKKLSLGFH